MRIFITGGAGFVPSSLAAHLAQDQANEIVLMDNLLTGFVQNVPNLSNVRFIKGDVNRYEDIAPVMTTFHFDVVFHYAAVVGVKRTLQNPVLVLEDIKGIQHILNLSKSTGVKRVFYSSSSEVYGEPVSIPQHEEFTPLNSRLPYAVVKNVGESFCKSYYQEYGLPYTLLRFFNTYGPKQSPDFVISKFIRAALSNEDITLYGDGLQTRTFCYIDDNVTFTEKIMRQDLLLNDVVNVGSKQQYTIRELADTVIELTGSRSRIVHLPPLPEGDMTRRQPDNAKMLDILGRELIPLREGLQRILKDWDQNTER